MPFAARQRSTDSTKKDSASSVVRAVKLGRGGAAAAQHVQRVHIGRWRRRGGGGGTGGDSRFVVRNSWNGAEISEIAVPQSNASTEAVK